MRASQMWPAAMELRSVCCSAGSTRPNQAAAPAFVVVRITDVNAPFDTALSDEERVP